MKKLAILVLTACTLVASWAMYTSQQKAKVSLLPFAQQNEKEGEGGETDSPDQAIKQDYLMRYDPAINRVPTERLIAAQTSSQNYTNSITQQPPPGSQPPTPTSITMSWDNMGPNNVGGRTRTLLVDKNISTNERVWAAGVGGGLWRCNNISSSTYSWTKVNDMFDNLAVTTIAQNPTNPQTMYFGTGEGWFNVDAIQGAGIWRSTNGGTTWARLSSTNNSNFFFVNKMVVATNGDVYAATRNGVFRSKTATDPTNNLAWELVLGGSGVSGYDLEIAANGTIYASIGSAFATGSVYKSTTGNASSWTQINTGLPTSALHRIELACAPSNANVVYAMVAGTTYTLSSCGGIGYMFRGVFKTTDAGANWTPCAFPIDADPCIAENNDLTRGMSWYCMALAVDPNNANTVYAGGIDLFKSTNSGSNWTQISQWEGNYGYQNVHADQHAIVFNPGSSAVIYFTNDGGIFRTATGTNATPTLVARNKNYNVTQFYAGAIKNSSTEFYVLAGAQDNGTQKFTINATNSPTTYASGGDGGFCHIDQLNPLYQFTANTGNNLMRSVDEGNTFYYLPSNGSGRFINPSDYDDQNKIMYSGGNSGELIRRTNLTAATPPDPQTILIPDISGKSVSHVKISPNNPTTVYVAAGAISSGTFVEPRVVKLTGANGIAIPVQDITASITLPAGTNISCVEVQPGNEQHIIITISNFGNFSKVYETNNGGTNWVEIGKTSNLLSDIPVYWAMFDPFNPDRVLLATDVGVWSTLNLDGVNTLWSPSNIGLANARVDMLVLRPADKTVIAVTHGRGVYKSSSLIPAANFTTSSPVCSNKPNDFFDTSTGTAISWAWDFNGDNIIDSNLKNPTGICGGINVPVKLTITTIDGQTLTKTKTISGSVCLGTSCSGKTDLTLSAISTINVAPNPFSNQTVISYSLEQKEQVNLQIFDLQGKLVSTVVNNELQETGSHKATFEATDLPSGIYYGVLQVGKKREVIKLLCNR
ncbi:MAG: T9SS type A sorting domain-containing protein [Chitinophagales bacterium]|jgi:hypothetical protein|nr:T9SS type A sorting domain-containing protein [Chitinophagales bacterium]